MDWNSPGQNTGVGSCSLLQGIFPTQGLNPCLPHCRGILYQLSHQGSSCLLRENHSSSNIKSLHLFLPFMYVPLKSKSCMRESKRDTDVQNSLLGSVGEGEGGMIWGNGMETCIIYIRNESPVQVQCRIEDAWGWCTG